MVLNVPVGVANQLAQLLFLVLDIHLCFGLHLRDIREEFTPSEESTSGAFQRHAYYKGSTLFHRAQQEEVRACLSDFDNSLTLKQGLRIALRFTTAKDSTTVSIGVRCAIVHDTFPASQSNHI